MLFAIFFSWKSIQLELFSLNVYTPASPVGIAFALLFLRFLWAISDVHTTHGKILCSFASTVCLAFAILSKQEVTLACLVVGCYFVCGRWLIQRVCDSAMAQSGGAGFGFLTLVCGIILGVGIYLILAIFVGWENLRQGLGGYGLGGNESSRLLETLYPTFSKWCQQFQSLSDFILLTLAGIALLVTISRWNSLRSEKWVYITLSVATLLQKKALMSRSFGPGRSWATVAWGFSRFCSSGFERDLIFRCSAAGKMFTSLSMPTTSPKPACWHR